MCDLLIFFLFLFFFRSNPFIRRRPSSVRFRSSPLTHHRISIPYSKTSSHCHLRRIHRIRQPSFAFAESASTLAEYLRACVGVRLRFTVAAETAHLHSSETETASEMATVDVDGRVVLIEPGRAPEVRATCHQLS